VGRSFRRGAELVTEVRVRDLGQRHSPLVDCLALELRASVFRHDDVHLVSWRGDNGSGAEPRDYP
jgi:hypothetical protein